MRLSLVNPVTTNIALIGFSFILLIEFKRRGWHESCKKYRPNVGVNDCVILFDGVCKLCNAWSRFIIKVDTQQRFKLCSVQSPEGQNILRYFEMPTECFDTMLYVEGNQCFDKSDAFLSVISKPGLPWRLLYIFKIIPKGIRNWFYKRIT